MVASLFLGQVVAGHQVASGRAASSPYPKGTIEMQTPHFQARGLDLSPFYPGTLNVSIRPYQLVLKSPQWTFTQVKWSPSHDPETFSFTPCALTWQSQTFNGLIYYPHPETKINHFQDPSVVELLLPTIAGIGYDDSVFLSVSAKDFIIES